MRTPSETPGPYSASFWTASASHFLFLAAFWMFVLLPVHLERLGAEEAWIGLLIGIEPAAAVLVRPALGGLLLRHGRLAVIRAGSLFNLAGVALYLVTDDIGLGMMAVRIVHGLGVGILFTTFFTYVADIAPADRRTEALAVFGITGILPTAVAPLVGEELVFRSGFPALFAAAALFSLGAALLGWNLPEPPASKPEPPRSFWGLAGDRRLRTTWLTTLVFSLALSSYVTFLAPYGHSRGLARIGVFFFCYSVSAATLRIVGRRLPDRFGPRRMLVPALASLGGGLYLLCGVDSPTILAVAGLLCGMGHGYLFPILSGLAVEGTDTGSRGNAMSLFTAIFDVGQMVGPALFGMLAEAFDYPLMFLAASLLVWATLVLWIPELRAKSDG